MLKRLLFALSCAIVGGALGYFVGLKPSVIGPRVTCFVGVGIGFVTGLGVADPSIRRVPFGLLGALVGGAIGYVVGEYVLQQVGARLATFVGLWLGFAVGAARSVLPLEHEE